MQKYKFINFILIPVLTFILVFLSLTVPSIAASTSTAGSLPVFIAPDETYNLDYFAQVFARKNPSGSNGVNANSFYNADNSLIYVSNQWSGGIDYTVVLFDSSSVYEFSLPINYDLFDINNYTLTFKYRDVINIVFRQYTGYDWNVVSIGNHVNPNSFTSVYFSGSYLPSYIGDLFYYNNDTSYPVFTNVEPIVVPTVGHAQDPANNLPTISYPIGMHPTAAPTVPTYISPTISTAPSIDTTNINTLVQSIFDLLSWMLQAIVSYIANFIDTVVDWFIFLGNLIVWLFKSYIDWLNNFIDWLYNIFKFLFEPIFNFLSSFFSFFFSEDDQLSIYDLLKEFKEDFSSRMSTLFSNSFFSNFWSNFYNNLVSSFDVIINAFSKIIGFFAWLYNHGLDSNNEFSLIVLINYLLIPDSSQFQTVIINHDQYGFIHSFGHLTSEADSLYDSLVNLSPAYKITLRSFTLCGVTIPDIDIDFTWYSQYKSVGDGIISAFLILGYFYWLFTRFNGILRGSASDVSQSVTEVKKL